MLLIDELINKVKSYNENADIDLIMRAYKMAEEHHKGQKRNSGEDYIIHPLNVSLILADMNMDTATIVAGLLHDVVEDTDVTLEDVKNEFGEEIADLVDGVTKLKKLNYLQKEAATGMYPVTRLISEATRHEPVALFLLNTKYCSAK